MFNLRGFYPFGLLSHFLHVIKHPARGGTKRKKEAEGSLKSNIGGIQRKWPKNAIREAQNGMRSRLIIRGSLTTMGMLKTQVGGL